MRTRSLPDQSEFTQPRRPAILVEVPAGGTRAHRRPALSDRAMDERNQRARVRMQAERRRRAAPRTGTTPRSLDPATARVKDHPRDTQLTSPRELRVLLTSSFECRSRASRCAAPCAACPR
ncbi:Hypothetical protein SMAX5B_009328 [Scophthalmus maximus]|uniref:Uncharacterized protein n=1 Tax=Scophthalmus maximus TaxID=52904 RepID=A0A2U9C5X5_SCOMX|nr:Hypothetical protein SMAX5B_009328 [Scophthalmus maximus]